MTAQFGAPHRCRGELNENLGWDLCCSCSSSPLTSGSGTSVDCIARLNSHDLLSHPDRQVERRFRMLRVAASESSRSRSISAHV